MLLITTSLTGRDKNQPAFEVDELMFAVFLQVDVPNVVGPSVELL